MTFSEIIDSLIDTVDVPEGKRNGEGYESARKEIHDDLSDVGDVEAACYHESAHFVYATFLGYRHKKDTSAFRVMGPKIEYHAPTDIEPEWYESTSSWLKAPGLSLPYTNESMEELAIVGVPGGESVRYFHPKRKPGDRNDWKRFEVLCKTARNHVGSLIQPAHIYWEHAAKTVREDFGFKRHNLLIEAKAELTKWDVFQSVFSNTKEIL